MNRTLVFLSLSCLLLPGPFLDPRLAPIPGTAPAYAADLESVERSQALTARIAQYRATIAEIESAQGAVATRLSEPLAALSDTLIESGQFEEALALLDQQLQIERINHGLYSAQQIPVIEKMMGLNAIRQDWGDVNLGVEHLTWLHQRESDLPESERLDSMKRLRDWRLLLLNHDIRDRQALHLLSIRDIAERSLDIGRAQMAADDPRLVNLLYERAQAELYIALAMALTSDTGSLLITETDGVTQTALRPPSGQYTSVHDIEMTYGPRTSTVVDRSFREAMRRHQAYLTEIRDAYAASGNEEARGMAMIYMADSVLMREQYESNSMTFAGRHRGQGNIGSAARMYEEAGEMLVNAGIRAEAVQQFFSCPVLLPVNEFLAEFPDAEAACTSEGAMDLGDIHLLVESVPGPPQAATVRAVAEDVTPLSYTTVSFSVRGNGQPGHIEVISAEPDTTRNRARARDVVEKLQFRPALLDGSPRTREQISMRLVLPEDQ